MDEVKAWKCENGHTLGQVARNGSGVRHLLLYRQALDLSLPENTPGSTTNPSPRSGEGTQEGTADADPGAVDVVAVVEGYVADVKCSVCGGMRTWFPGQESLNRLIKQVQRMRKG